MSILKNLLNTFISAFRSKIAGLWNAVRKWSNPAFIRNRVLLKVRAFFVALLDVKPRDRKDYYPIFRWLVSKRLAFAIVVGLGLVSVLYISSVLPEGFLKRGDASGVPTYRYRSIPLKFHSGSVKILARSGYVAYDGEVEKGAASGKGTLYGADGSKVYEGQFADNKYNGTGTLYYASGIPQYVGSFTDNLFHGTGDYYRSNGTLEYSGDYIAGVRTGTGSLYNSVARQIFRGSFLNDEIVYRDFLARPTQEVASLYSGDTQVYQSALEYCVSMPEIQALYSVKDGSNTLENEWTVDKIYVLRSSLSVENTVCATVRQLKAALGEPLYYGTAWVTLPEAVALNQLAQELPERLTRVDITATAGLENVYAVSAYDRDAQVYLYTFERAGILYTFYFAGAGESGFVMYSMEKT